jgi:hypothetical protein
VPIEHTFDDRTSDGPPAAVDAPGLADDVEARIVGWWPKDVPDDPVQHAIVDTCRDIAVAGRPGSAKQAGSVLATLRRFLIWLAGTEPDVDLTEGQGLLTPARLAAYLEDPAGLGARPKGSADAAMSFLRRLAPAGGGLTDAVEAPGLDGTAVALGVDGDPPAPAPAPAPPAAAVNVSGLPHQVGTAIGAYVPQVLPSARWAPIEGFCREVVAASVPRSPAAARSRLRSVAYLAAWVAEARRPVRVDVVFAPGTVVEFVEVLVRRQGDASAAAHRTNLVRVARAVRPGVSFDEMPQVPRRNPQGPLSSDDVAAAFAWADGHRSERTRRHCRALVVLAAGAGLDGAEAPWVTPDDVVEVAAGLGVEVRRPDVDGVVHLERTSLVAPAFEARVRQAAADARDAGDQFLVGGFGDRRRRVETLMRSGRCPVELIRLRHTWLLSLVDEARLPIETIKIAAGLGTLRPIRDLLDARPTPPSALAPFERKVAR